jgi:8-hydroxy-5-deazaflavin:NADPH oxidoreductase
VRIAVIGAGNVGAALGRAWVGAGHTVTFGVRNPDAPGVVALVDALDSGVAAESPAAAVTGADVVVLAVPGASISDVVPRLANDLAGKIVINATNVMDPNAASTNSAVKAAAPEARVVRAFSTLGAENFVQPVIGGVPADILWCGPDDAVDIAEQLIDCIGLCPVRVTADDAEAIIDAVFHLWVDLAMRQGRGRRLSINVVTD